ncbi:class I SAM-dependent methyltransferase [Nocardia sp. NEAU-G5]|uniref:Class I SAM-dependent methyltransferase n=1 Tax=Nocardia albiluteola TaxID=2842303 RepID=A0ABS6B444_9NOCA|nr:class I SAM-dependent methyltransferase [Nocardia albiluteola]MBU3064120.1 class I SAM-dependent methyltransferase [Nocardia albiluteola]
MTTAAEHYDHLLAPHYTWMLGGDIDATVTAQFDLLHRLGLTVCAEDQAAAVDLGCGPGPQTLALVRLGYASVIAVDTSAVLLAELRNHANRHGVNRVVRPLHADLRGALSSHATPGSVSTVVCMGDTLPHLPSRADVQRLITDVALALRSGGSFVVTYRDLTAERRGTDRFIPVRHTDDQILTCFLDYVDQDTVMVHDLLHTRLDGTWHLHTGRYPKLRLPHQWLADQCRTAGLDVRHTETTPHGLQILHTVKP